MSNDEIRSRKALVLLELDEAEVLVSRLAKEAKWLGHEFQSFGAVLVRNPASILESDQDKYSHVSVVAAYDLSTRIKEATAQLTEITLKKELLFAL